MSTEKIIYEEQVPIDLTEPVVSKIKLSGRVDINHLLARVRNEKQKENKINLIFFGVFTALVLVAGIILSI